MATIDPSETANREITATRIINAPRELVFKVWTEPEHIARWWGPNGFTITIHKMDVKPGGEWHFIMHGPDGVDYPNEVTYSEVAKPQRLVYTHAAPKFRVTVTFEEQGNKTKLTMRMVFESAEEFKLVTEKYKAIEGQQQTLNRLEEHLSEMLKGQELVVTRVLNAPRKLVYKAFSESEALAQWWGPVGFEMCGSKLEFRPGGIYHYGMKSPDGNMMWGKFKYLEIVEPERIVFINSFSDKEGNVTRAPFDATFPLEVMNIITLTEKEGKTTLILRGRPVNATEIEQKTFRDMYSGMEQGFGGTFDQLRDYLDKISKTEN